MKKMALIFVGLCISSSAFAGVSEIRNDVMKLAMKATPSLQGQCHGIEQAIDDYENKLADLHDQVVALSLEDGHGTIDNIHEALFDIRSAQDSLITVESDCHNTPGVSPGAMLVEMYMIHADTALMIFQHGVGADLMKIQ